MKQEESCMPDWSFYCMHTCFAEKSSKTFAIAKCMTTPSIQALPEGSIETALQLLQKMQESRLSSGSGYARLLILALHREPILSSLIKLALALTRALMDAERLESCAVFYGALPRDTQAIIAPKLTEQIIDKAVKLFSPEDTKGPLRIADRYLKLPQIKAFARLPGFCVATPKSLPCANDARMLTALMSQAHVIGAVNSEVIDRLFERAGEGLPNDIKISRLRLKRLQTLNRLEAARDLSRQITRHPDSSMTDLHSRVKILAGIDRLGIVNRYLRWLDRSHGQGRIDNNNLASRLWALGFAKRALDALDKTEELVNNAKSVHLALLSLISLRRFGEAQDLLTKAMAVETPVNQGVARKIHKAKSLLDKLKIQSSPGTDATLSIIDHISRHISGRDYQAYEPIARRVLITANSIAIGGAERQVTAQAVALAGAADVERVMILTNRESETVYNLGYTGSKLSVRCAEREVQGTTSHSLEGIDLGILSQSFGLSVLRRFYDEIIRFRPEVVHVRSGQHIEVALAALLAGTPRIVVHFGSMTRGQQSTGNDLSRLREELLEQGLGIMAMNTPTVRVVANSQSAANDWAMAMGLEVQKVGVITNCVDANAFRRSTDTTKRSEEELVIGGVFRLAPVKDPLLWLQTAAEIAKLRPQTQFIIVGDGPMLPEVERMINKLGLRDRVRLAGVVTTGIASWIEKMDVFLMTSRTESLPNAVIEAQLMGIPVVAPDVGGISEVFANAESGIVCARNVNALSEALLVYLDDAKLRKRVRVDAPNGILRKFSVAKHLENLRITYGWPTST